MLSEDDIKQYIKSKDIFISGFKKKNLLPASYVLHLDNKFAFAKGGKVKANKLDNIKRMYATQTADKVILKPGQFLLARTHEKISISTKLSMLVDGKSTLARLGLTITQTAMLIQPGHGIPTPRKIILEIKNDGPFEVELKKGIKIVDAVFFEMKTPPLIPYDSSGVYGKEENIDKMLPKWR